MSAKQLTKYIRIALGIAFGVMVFPADAQSSDASNGAFSPIEIRCTYSTIAASFLREATPQTDDSTTSDTETCRTDRMSLDPSSGCKLEGEETSGYGSSFFRETVGALSSAEMSRVTPYQRYDDSVDLLWSIDQIRPVEPRQPDRSCRAELEKCEGLPSLPELNIELREFMSRKTNLECPNQKQPPSKQAWHPLKVMAESGYQYELLKPPRRH